MKRSIQLFIVAVLLVMACPEVVFGQNTPGNSTAIPLFQDEDDDFDPDERNGFSFGMNLGVYFPNKKSAIFYDGSGLYDINDNQTGKLSIPERLLPPDQGGRMTPNQYAQIRDYYNATSYEFPNEFNNVYWPQNMRYNIAFLIGGKIKYNLNYTIEMNFNFSKLKATDVYTIRLIGTTNQQNAQSDIRTLDIRGEEDRFHFTLGYRTGFEMGPKSNWFFGLGGSMLGTKLIANEVSIAERNFDLLIGLTNPQQPISYRPRTDIGFGGYLSTGLEMFFSENYELEAGVVGSYDKVVIGTYEDYLTNFSFYLTFSI